MPAYRYFLDSEFKVGDISTLTGDEGRHAALVMRREKNDRVELINGRGVLAHALVLNRIKLGISVTLTDVMEMKPKCSSLSLVQFMTKWENLCWIVEKATELGIANITVVLKCSRQQSLNQKQLHRLQKIMRSALKQSGELFLPKLEMVNEIEFFMADLRGCSFFADIEGPPLLSNNFTPPLDVYRLCVGSEKGFDTDQRNALTLSGWRSVNLHSNTLRAETAAICGLALLQSRIEIERSLS